MIHKIFKKIIANSATQMLRQAFIWYQKKFILLFISLIFVHIISLIPIEILGRITEVLFLKKESIELYVLAFLISSLTLFFITPKCSYYLAFLCEQTLSRLAQGWIQKILSKDYKLFENKNIGTLISSLQRGIDAYKELLRMMIAQLIPGLIEILILTFYMVYIGGWLILPLIILGSILFFFLQWKLMKWRRSYINAVNDTEDEWYDSFSELFMNAKTIKIARAEHTSTKRLHKSYLDYSQQASQLARASGVLEGTQQLSTHITVVSVFTMGFVLLESHDQLSLASFVTLFLLCYRLVEAFMRLFNSIKNLDEHNLDRKAMDELLVEPTKPSQKKPLPILSNPHLTLFPFHLKFQDDSEEVRLENNDKIHIPYRAKVAITGASGSGKTLLIESLLGVKPTPKKTFYIDALDLSDLGSKEIIEHIFFSEAKGAFFSGPFQRSVLLDHLTYNSEIHAPQLEALELLSFASSTSFDHETLSDGEKKRLALFRALRWNKPITILDEPTEALDATLSKKVWQEIFKSFQEKTLICITHDLTWLPHFDLRLHIEDHQLKKVPPSP